MEEDIERRARLRQRFNDAFECFTIVQAVDLRGSNLPPALRFHPRAWRDPTQLELSRRQIGCALSHVRVLEEFLQSGEKFCIVLEDDVIGDADGVRSACDLMRKLPPDAFVLLGGQEGLKGRRYLAGTKLAGTDAWRLLPISLQFAARAVSYGVTRRSAELILMRQTQSLDHPDHWSALLRGYHNVFYTELFEHPVDLRWSHMEQARLQAKRRFALTRVLEDGVVETARRSISKVVLVVTSPFLGMVRIPEKLDSESVAPAYRAKRWWERACGGLRLWR